MVSKTLFGITTIAYTIFLVVVSLINISGVPSLGSDFDDKIYHFLAYFLFAYLWTTYLKPSKKKNKLLIVFICLIMFGIILELIQHIINPNRVYDTYDLIANCLGVLIGTLLAKKYTIITLK